MKRVEFCIGILILLSLLCVGCNDKPAEAANPKPSATVAEETKDPETILHEQLRSGNYQINAAMESLQTARDDSQAIIDSKDKSLREPMEEVVDRLDEVGVTLAEKSDEPPSLEEVRKAFAANDDARLDLIEAVTDALLATEEAAGIVNSLLEQAKFQSNRQLNEVDKGLETCLEALREAIKALGGKLPEPSAEEPPKKS